MYFIVDEDTCNRIQGVLEQQADKPQNLRVYIAGMGWGGPSFGLGLDQSKEDDVQEIIGNVNFIMEKYLAETFGQVEVKWNGYSYSVGPVKSDGSSSSSC